ncbi:MAG: hypothetical protein AB7F98_09620 [Novosphingobium sp.]
MDNNSSNNPPDDLPNPSPNFVREAPATFPAEDSTGWASAMGSAAQKQYKAKVFKSGNSLALRLPKALGLEAGMEMEITALPDGTWSLKRVEPPKARIDISGFAGKLPGFKPAPREDFEERPSAIARRKALQGE